VEKYSKIPWERIGQSIVWSGSSSPVPKMPFKKRKYCLKRRRGGSHTKEGAKVDFSKWKPVDNRKDERCQKIQKKSVETMGYQKQVIQYREGLERAAFLFRKHQVNTFSAVLGENKQYEKT